MKPLLSLFLWLLSWTHHSVRLTWGQQHQLLEILSCGRTRSCGLDTELLTHQQVLLAHLNRNMALINDMRYHCVVLCLDWNKMSGLRRVNKMRKRHKVIKRRLDRRCKVCSVWSQRASLIAVQRKHSSSHKSQVRRLLSPGYGNRTVW